LIDFKIRPNIEYLTLLGTKSINGTGNATDNIITGNTGDNVINGAGGADLVRGLAGSDTYYVDDAGDVVVEAAGAGADIDTVKASIDYTLTANVENLSLIGADGIAGTGNGLGNIIVGNTGDNRLAGKLGGDTLKGRGGSDTFVFDTRLGEADADHVVDFTSADQIELSSAIFTALSSGPLSAAAFKDLSAGLLDADDRILYDRSTGELFYDRDGSGSAASELFAVLDNHAALTAASFIIS
jgi:Ca2+-binding RTX toxin-like protein